jgi:hypothetical protein
MEEFGAQPPDLNLQMDSDPIPARMMQGFVDSTYKRYSN